MGKYVNGRWQPEPNEIASGEYMTPESQADIQSREISRLSGLVRQRDEQIAMLREELIEARISIEDWAVYVSPRVQQKNNLAGDLARIDKALAATAQPEQEECCGAYGPNGECCGKRIPVAQREQHPSGDSQEQDGGWRSMESAPRSGKWVRGRKGEQEFDMRYEMTIFFEPAWLNRKGGMVFPDEWRPLPAPPTRTEAEGADDPG